MTCKFYRISDGAAAMEADALDERGCLRDGYTLSIGARSFYDSANSFTLRDAAGKPVQLADRDTGLPVKLNEALIEAIHVEAAKLGMTVQTYVNQVLRYREATDNLTPNSN